MNIDGVKNGIVIDHIKAGKSMDLYKYLNLAYLSPKIVNQLLDGTLIVNLQKLFEIASKNLSFDEQERFLNS